MAGRFQGELMTALPEWKKRLEANADGLHELEREVHAAFARGADLLVVGLMAVVMKTPDWDDACECTRREAVEPLSRGRSRSIQVRLLGGLVIWITSLYCAPAKSRPGDEKVRGMYVELARFGFG